MPQFAATINKICGGVKAFTISAAVKNIEGWETALSDMDTSGAKGMVRDLGRLKKLLQAEEIDGEAVKELIGKLGEATVKLAGKAESKNAEKVKQLGEALTAAARQEATAA